MMINAFRNMLLFFITGTLISCSDDGTGISYVAEFSYSIDEDAPNDAVVGSVFYAPGGENFSSWLITRGNTGNTFGVNPESGEVFVRDDTVMDFESVKSYSLTIEGSRSDEAANVRVDIGINNVNDEVPSIPVGQRFRLPESVSDGRFVGLIRANDDDEQPFGAETLSLSGPERSVTIREFEVEDVAGNQYDLLLAEQVLGEIQGVGNSVTYSSISPDNSDEYYIISVDSYLSGTRITAENSSFPALGQWQILSGNEDGVFRIDPVNGALYVDDSSSLNYGLNPSYTLEVSVTDGVHTSAIESVSIDLVDTEQGRPGSNSDRTVYQGIEHIIHISVDGLQSQAIEVLGAGNLPAIYKIRALGAYTDNARTDGTIAETMPGHTSQFSGRDVYGADGHGWALNFDLKGALLTLHDLRYRYVASVFDVVHDHGLSTALYTGKPKFEMFARSWDEVNGAEDNVLPDDGRGKIDKFVFNASTSDLVSGFINDLDANEYSYAFLHIKDPDSAGHEFNWSRELQSPYLNAVKEVDSYLGLILDFVDSDPTFADSAVVIVTSDHGGVFDHNEHYLDRENNELDSGVIPFYVYGKSIPVGIDLYTLAADHVSDPGSSHPFSSDVVQPIRNGDAPNLILKLLGLPVVPGSSINGFDL